MNGGQGIVERSMGGVRTFSLWESVVGPTLQAKLPRPVMPAGPMALASKRLPSLLPTHLPSFSCAFTSPKCTPPQATGPHLHGTLVPIHQPRQSDSFTTTLPYLHYNSNNIASANYWIHFHSFSQFSYHQHVQLHHQTYQDGRPEVSLLHVYRGSRRRHRQR